MSTQAALITGASRGIGRSIATQLALDGYDIAFCYRTEAAAAEAVASEIRALGRRVFHAQCDVSNLESVQAFVRGGEEAIGPLSLVVNSAGIIKDAPLVTMAPESWQQVLATNLDGVFHVCRSAVFAFMKRKSGCIINLSSIAGVFGNATQVNYSASKAGIIGFSRALAKEVGPYGIRVNVVAPGFIHTDMTSTLQPERLQKVLATVPLRRAGEPEEIADVVSFLASERARYITGQVIQVDGGLVL
jgi:3-oxoacyl-[acyl-carrier protein] reductase